MCLSERKQATSCFLLKHAEAAAITINLAPFPLYTVSCVLLISNQHNSILSPV